MVGLLPLTKAEIMALICVCVLMNQHNMWEQALVNREAAMNNV